MKMLARYLAVVALSTALSLAALAAHGQLPKVYLDTTGAVDGTTSVRGEPVLTYNSSDIGSSDSLWIWTTADQVIDTTLGVDVFSDTSCIIRFTGAEIFNPDVVSNLTGATLDTRWDGINDMRWLYKWISQDRIRGLLSLALLMIT